MTLHFLRKIGLSEGEIKVYSALLDEGLSPINRIHEKTGIERRNIYDILNKLIEKGFVTYITENKRRLFQVSHPGKILGYIDEKKHELEEIKKETELHIPSILQKFNFKKPMINAEVFRGEEGVKAVWEDMLNYKNIFWIGSGRYVPKKLPLWFNNWNKKRIKKKVRWFNLLRHEIKSEVKTPMLLEEIRFLPKDFSGNPVVICIYGNKVVNFLLGEDYFAFVIESKELAENYRKYHKYLWGNAAK
ncbi:hypothetical protein JXA85_07640 [Candidatus Woesearchaeota archaeon]|nr:hypothetical protein [Candidatus Woesearchaeota archaeon]